MEWQPISPEAQSGSRVLVAGGKCFEHNRGSHRQSFPALVVWQDGEFVVCDNDTQMLVRDPTHWCEVPRTPWLDASGRVLV